MKSNYLILSRFNLICDQPCVYLRSSFMYYFNHLQDNHGLVIYFRTLKMKRYVIFNKASSGCDMMIEFVKPLSSDSQLHPLLRLQLQGGILNQIVHDKMAIMKLVAFIMKCPYHGIPECIHSFG